MNWKEEFEHGVLWQDFQHKKFVGNINLLISMVVSSDENENKFRKIANFTIQYCNNHFKTEELYMKRHAYPRAKNHIVEHDLFIKDLKEILVENKTGDSEKATKLLNKLMSWFVKHILETDKYLAEFIKKHNLS